jgi:hypothetical protein
MFVDALSVMACDGWRRKRDGRLYFSELIIAKAQSRCTSVKSAAMQHIHFRKCRIPNDQSPHFLRREWDFIRRSTDLKETYGRRANSKPRVHLQKKYCNDESKNCIAQ